MQRWKLERLAAPGLATPGVRYLPVDFAAQELATELASAGLSPTRPTFFAWLGVAHYIAERATLATLSLAARHAAGSEIAFDVILPFEGLTPAECEISRAAELASCARGERWLSYFQPEPFASRLGALGFRRVDRLAPEGAARLTPGNRPR